VKLYGPDGAVIGAHPLARREEEDGIFEVELPGVGPGALYKFVIDGKELPDPYARFLPQGVHGPALVTQDRYPWRHGQGVFRPLSEHVFYELHVGTFTEEGTYAGVRAHLPDLAALGVTAIELLPLAAFAGQRGWGYDGVAHYAPFATYGTPDELRELIDEAHGLGLSVFLDVVYNHFGPAGNYLGAYSPAYFTREVQNAWGEAPNFAHPAMRGYVLDNARYWLTEFRFDGFRLDATHAILDPSPRHILREFADEVAELSPRKLLIAEDDRNEPACVTELGMDALWADDFHHQVRVTFTRERDGYYVAYEPGVERLAQTIRSGWFYEGQVYPRSGKARGKRAEALPAAAFVYCIQNHDQIGNRAIGDRLAARVSLEAYCAASALLLFLPMTPLLFMGQEWAASSPFQFFTDHDEELGHAISRGRREEFKHFESFSDPAVRAQIPDPQARETFERSRLRWDERDRSPHARVLSLYRRLLELRRTDPVLKDSSRERLSAEAIGEVLVVQRWNERERRVLVANFGAQEASYESLPVGLREGSVVLRTDGVSEIGDRLPAFTAVILARPETAASG
jgi:maltooligosyltrehalose trehalohydrolase